jgi:site-specific recombinase XerD
LRHTLATHLIQKGVDLKAVADVLGHRSLNTTARYAKVNLPMLAQIAQPWPEVK